MDPYLEGSDWPDFHNSLAYVIKKTLAPQVAPAYVVRLEKYVLLDTEPAQSLGIVYPDLEVWQKPPGSMSEPSVLYESSPILTPPTLTIPLPGPIEVRVPVVEIRDMENKRLITSIEILSPVNKRSPAFENYVKKQQKLHEKGVHLLEIDLLRQGRRRLKHPVAVSAHYLVSLLRGDRPAADLWAIDIRDFLPVIPVPLKAPDGDAILDLQKVFDTVYEESFYAGTLPYKKDPPLPAFSPEELTWIQNRLSR